MCWRQHVNREHSSPNYIPACSFPPVRMVLCGLGKPDPLPQQLRLNVIKTCDCRIGRSQNIGQLWLGFKFLGACENSPLVATLYILTIPQYMAATERNIPPTDVQRAQGADYHPAFHGFNGAVNTSFPVRFIFFYPGSLLRYRCRPP